MNTQSSKNMLKFKIINNLTAVKDKLIGPINTRILQTHTCEMNIYNKQIYNQIKSSTSNVKVLH